MAIVPTNRWLLGKGRDIRWESRVTPLAALARNEACDRLSVPSFILYGVLWQGLAFTGNPDLVALELHGD